MKYSNTTIPGFQATSARFQNLPARTPAKDDVARAGELRSALVKKFNAEYPDVEARLVYQAVNEAHALASLTPVPLLLLPLLAEEKVQQAGTWSAHQHSLLGGNPLAFAA